MLKNLSLQLLKFNFLFLIISDCYTGTMEVKSGGMSGILPYNILCGQVISLHLLRFDILVMCIKITTSKIVWIFITINVCKPNMNITGINFKIHGHLMHYLGQL